MKFLVSLFLILSSSAFAQIPSLNLPEMPKQSLTLIFKDITRHDQFRLVLEALTKSKRADSLIMKRAERGFVEYEGNFFGEPATLLTELQTAAQGLQIESKQKTEGLEIFVTPQGS